MLERYQHKDRLRGIKRNDEDEDDNCCDGYDATWIKLNKKKSENAIYDIKKYQCIVLSWLS